jgi:type IV pilus assembly protein PilB
MAANPQSVPLSGLARALVQADRLKEVEAESMLAQAAATRASLIEQIVLAKKATFLEVARFAADKFGYPLLDLAAFDEAHIQRNAIDRKLIASHRVVPLHKRGNRLAIAIADPTNLRALDEVRFQTGLAVDPVVVEDNKLSPLVAKLSESPSPETPR